MGRRRERLTRALAIGLALGAFGLQGTALAGTPDSPTTACAAAVFEPPTHLAEVRDATLCLLNAERRRYGLGSLRWNPRLALAGERHARDMVQQHYFAHQSLSGATFTDRIRLTGYMKNVRHWLIGENLGWGTGPLGSAQAIVDAFMHSPAHRANLLKPGYTEVGIAVIPGTHTGRADGAEYAVEFGDRS